MKDKNRDILKAWENVRVSERVWMMVLFFGVLACFIMLILAESI